MQRPLLFFTENPSNDFDELAFSIAMKRHTENMLCIEYSHHTEKNMHIYFISAPEERKKSAKYTEKMAT